jgi:hypothetical protein
MTTKTYNIDDSNVSIKIELTKKQHYTQLDVLFLTNSVVGDYKFNTLNYSHRYILHTNIDEIINTNIIEYNGVEYGVNKIKKIEVLPEFTPDFALMIEESINEYDAYRSSYDDNDDLNVNVFHQLEEQINNIDGIEFEFSD